MIEQGKYCVDILNQIKATKNAISTVEGKVLQTHLQECIKESFNGNGDSAVSYTHLTLPTICSV